MNADSAGQSQVGQGSDLNYISQRIRESTDVVQSAVNILRGLSERLYGATPKEESAQPRPALVPDGAIAIVNTNLNALSVELDNLLGLVNSIVKIA